MDDKIILLAENPTIRAALCVAIFFKCKPHVHKPQATKISPSPALSAKKGHIYAVFVVYVVRHCKRPPIHYPTSRWADGAISR